MSAYDTMLSSAELLERHPGEAVRLVALDWLAQASAARERLADTSDDEALHDFRVAIRRLRSTIKAFRRELADSVSRKSRDRLRRVAQATNGGRDAEVQLEWLDTQRHSLYSRHRPGAAWFRERLREQKKDADALLHEEVTHDFDRVRDTLRRSLPAYTLALRVGDAAPPPRFADALAARIRDAAAELSARLGEVTGPAASDAAHEARIAAKRVRYLLEPVADAVGGAPSVVKRLKQLQDALGELHDLDVVGVELAGAIRELDRKHDAPASSTDAMDAAIEPTADAPPPPAPEPPPQQSSPTPDPRPGLACLARRARTRREVLYTTLANEWFAGAAASFLSSLERVARRLAAPAPEVEPRDDARDDVSDDGAPPMEIERKYLLRELPPRARDSEYADVEQGWIPGERLRERIRRVRRGDAERYYRTVKLGAGLRRIELEEETTAELWRALWPLTESRRIGKRRYEVADGAMKWEIDDFPDRGLVLAEIELPNAEFAVVVPEWLAPYVVREVTDDQSYTNFRLAETTTNHG